MLFNFFVPIVDAQGIGLAKGGLEKSGRSFFQPEVAAIAGTVIQSILAIIGVVFLVIMVYGGILWLTSQGEEKKISNARGYIFHSILGLIIVMAAGAITQYVVNELATAALR